MFESFLCISLCIWYVHCPHFQGLEMQTGHSMLGGLSIMWDPPPLAHLPIANAYSHLPTFYCLLKIPTTSYWTCLVRVNLYIGQICFLHRVAKPRPDILHILGCNLTTSHIWLGGWGVWFQVFGAFLRSSQSSFIVDGARILWHGQWPLNRQGGSLTINGLKLERKIRLAQLPMV